MGNSNDINPCESRCPNDICHWRLFSADNYRNTHPWTDMCQHEKGPKIYLGASRYTAIDQFKSNDISSFGLSVSWPGWSCKYTFCENTDGTGNCVEIEAYYWDRTQCCAYKMNDFTDYVGNIQILFLIQDAISYLKVEAIYDSYADFMVPEQKGCHVRTSYVEPGPFSHIEPPNDELPGYEPKQMYLIGLLAILSLCLVICTIINGLKCLRKRNKRNKYKKVAQVTSDIDSDIHHNDLYNIDEQEQKGLNK